jgi:dTDP-4-amino-4,6-dideoxygalactose transaminase
MYRTGQYQCLSFGPGKPLDNTRGGAVLLDNEEHYKRLKRMSNDGRDLSSLDGKTKRRLNRDIIT